MAQDWEYHKARYMEDVLEEANNRISNAENCPSPIEKIVCLELYKLYEIFPIGECKIRSQVMLGKYAVDFIVTYETPGIDHEYAVVIECDGMDFHGTKEQASKDKARDRYMTLEGYEVLRYTGSEICEDPYRIVNDVKNLIYRYRGWV